MTLGKGDLRRLACDPMAWSLTRRDLRRRMASADTVEEVIHLADTFVGRGFYNSIRPLHNPGETRALTELVSKRRPKVIMEIGTCSGGTLFVWSRCVRDAALIVSVDLYHGNYGGGYHPFRKKL